MTDPNGPADFDTLTPDEQSDLLEWIRESIRPTRTCDPRHNSYTLKHVYSNSRKAQHPGIGDFYITNGQFKGAMLKSGYKPLSVNALNWRFRTRLKK